MYPKINSCELIGSVSTYVVNVSVDSYELEVTVLVETTGSGVMNFSSIAAESLEWISEPPEDLFLKQEIEKEATDIAVEFVQQG